MAPVIPSTYASWSLNSRSTCEPGSQKSVLSTAEYNFPRIYVLYGKYRAELQRQKSLHGGGHEQARPLTLARFQLQKTVGYRALLVTKSS